MKTTRILIFLAAALLARADTIELANGNKVEGKVLENNAEAKTLTVEFNLGGTLTKRTVPYATVKAITVNGARTVLAEQKSAVLTPAEVQALIAKVGPREPDWLKSTKLNYPKTLDLSWPEGPPQGGWNNQKNVGQFIWDIINPNSGRWQEGVKLLHHILDSKPDAALKDRVTKEVANMYFRFFQDYARAAWWWQQAGVTIEDPPAFHLAECYWRLGSKQMALDLINQTQLVYLDSIKLLGDMGETDRAVKMAQYYDEHDAWLLAGDACRLAGRVEEAQTFYEKVVNTPPGAGQKPERLKRTQNRAQASLDALKLFALAEVAKVADGTYKDSSLGYEGQIEVSVKVRGKKIEDVKVTQHKEKQYYSALTDVPAQIIAKQGVKGVDATSRATITGDAIINATAKALAQGAK
ncbi:MAG: FMN-binding protein [Verrucomicrobiaceae bacterium]|nr:FMN-binding protein [Verrucomicrobiaceae bacterium]